MILQGSNVPIRLIFEDVNDMPSSISVTLSNEIAVLRKWSTPEVTIDYAEREITIPITQEESLAWEPGACRIEIKMIDIYGNTTFAVADTHVSSWQDKEVLEG